ncbi:hypothetical protein EVAR_5401_1 [Eumeta japonica]|uniref:Reverse transcriptase/retrotransposon-derived protein RNase H-like domain-containing protein n=1 Tax=Eumeta variegata TaxID=151549 RepID=A0A4C2ABF6_EUMVA|nr:hypothetical protein EVAR_5401_1 [Eumeta japonica]
MGAKWMWSEAHQSAFDTVKRALVSELALAHYDPRLCTVLTVTRVRPAGRRVAQQQEDGSESDSVRFSGAHQYVRSANNVADYLSRSHPQARAAADGSGAGTCAASADVEDGEINSFWWPGIDADIDRAVGACAAARPGPGDRGNAFIWISLGGGRHPRRGGRALTTGVSPAQLMLGRNVRTRLDLLCPHKDVSKHVASAPSAASLAQNVSRSQTSQSKYFGRKRKLILPSVIKL